MSLVFLIGAQMVWWVLIYRNFKDMVARRTLALIAVSSFDAVCGIFSRVCAITDQTPDYIDLFTLNMFALSSALILLCAVLVYFTREHSRSYAL